MTSKALHSHFVSRFYVLDSAQAHTPNVESGSIVESLMFAVGVFHDALLYYKKTCAESSKILNCFIHATLLMRDPVR